MKFYGIKIGDYGVEFSELKNRTEALNNFIKGSTIKINSSGVRYSPQGELCFGTYERDNKDIVAICYECKNVFDIDVCYQREYKYLASWKNNGVDSHDQYVCDGCHMIKQKEVKDFLIKQTKERLGVKENDINEE